ncbi:hypothetical protein ACFLS7_00905 [Bacteroidota bacterium]
MASIAVVIALLARLPLLLTTLSPDNFYFRNLPILIFAGLTTWFIIKNGITGWKQILLLALPTMALAIFVNLLPEKLTDATTLALIHAPLFMVFIFALAFVSLDLRNTGKVSGFIRYCGELVIMTGLLAIAGAILSGMTILLFGIIGMEIEEIYMENIGITGLVVLPLIAAWLIDCVVVIIIFPVIFSG